ncbi:hypothetical protein BOSEA31B_13872 [Hyphomicrobiales bacterium]|nr:hypothetical protein BOSEA31B_13872 [Hyphomicrobiales bacterium]CAH1699647.1 hypothetical protein BOSEA1005_12700 [Hyphomicrobiales bacterium]CAI0343382.1 hypothetical protein BO1005MUT1_240026 [Hyphomicrobiales bacterium]
MARQLTVKRIGEEWVARDATGAMYGQSPDLFETIEAAEHLAKRLGATVALGREAQNYLLTQAAKLPRRPQRDLISAPEAQTADAKSGGPQDRSRINLIEDDEVRFWTDKFGVSKPQLEEC